MKIVLCGDKDVGKKEFHELYCGKGFQSKYKMTSGADFALKEATVDGKLIKFQIFDLAEQQRFRSVRYTHYLGALGAILIFDVTRKETFDNLQLWIKEIFNHNGQGVISVVILGNKVELLDSGAHPDSITDEIALRYCKKLTEQTKSQGFEAIYFPFSTKNKDKRNADLIFEHLAKSFFSI